MKKIILPLFISTTFLGCASITQDKNQSIKVETVSESGETIENASCVLKNDRGEFYVETPKYVQVRKSAGDLIVTCDAPDQPTAEGKLISRTGAAVFGNIIFGGVIGGVLDTASGVAFNYPDWVRLVFGKTLVFDRSKHKNNMVLLGEEMKTADDKDTSESAAAPAKTETEQSSELTQA